MFIVFEGIDGSGTTTHARLLAERLGAKFTYQPSQETTPGVIVREIFERKRENPGSETIEVLLAADRYIHTSSFIKDWLASGHVVCDRYVMSGLAYTDINDDDFLFINEWAIENLVPDLVIFIDVPLETALERLGRRSERTLYEYEMKLRRVRSRYKRWIDDNSLLEYPIRVVETDSEKSIDETHEAIWAIVEEMIND